MRRPLDDCTLDLQILGQAAQGPENGLSAPRKLTAKTLANLGTKWKLGPSALMGAKRRSFGKHRGPRARR